MSWVLGARKLEVHKSTLTTPRPPNSNNHPATDKFQEFRRSFSYTAVLDLSASEMEKVEWEWSTSEMETLDWDKRRCTARMRWCAFRMCKFLQMALIC